MPDRYEFGKESIGMIHQVIDHLKSLNRPQIITLAKKSGVNWQVLYKISLGITRDPRVKTLLAIEPHIKIKKGRRT
jgi:predicted transcriptional regulator